MNEEFSIHPDVEVKIRQVFRKSWRQFNKYTAFVAEYQLGKRGILMVTKDAGEPTVEFVTPNLKKKAITVNGVTVAVTPAPYSNADALLSSPSAELFVEPEPEPAPSAPEPVVINKAKRVPRSAKSNQGAMDSFRATLGDVPTLDAMFSLQAKDATLTWLPINKLAIFCDVNKFKEISNGSQVQKALGELAFEMQDTGNNTTNLQAEVDPSLVGTLLKEVLEVGYLTNDIKVTTLEGADTTSGVYQVVSGRHRVALMGLLYGPEANIAVRILPPMTEEQAFYATIQFNQTRAIKRREAVAFNGMVARWRSDNGVDGEIRAAQKQRTASKVYNTLVTILLNHAVIQQDDVFGLNEVPILEKKGKMGTYALTFPIARKFLHTVITNLPSGGINVLEDFVGAKSSMIAALSAMNGVYKFLPSIDPDFDGYLPAWSSYGSEALARLVVDWMVALYFAKQTPDINHVCAGVANIIIRYLRAGGQDAVDNFNRCPSKQLVELIREFASEKGIELLSPEARAAIIQF